MQTVVVDNGGDILKYILGFDLQKAVEAVCGVHGVRGYFAMIDGTMAFCGDLPEFVLLRGLV